MAEIDVCIVPQQPVPVGIQTEQQQIGMGGCGCGGGINPAFWGKIYGDINAQTDLMELISGGAIGKDNIPVLTVAGEEPETAQEGDYYINTTYQTLNKYTSGDWVEETPSVDNIYIAQDTSHMWLWNGQSDEFRDVTGSEVNGVIYINDLSELDDFTTKGIYTICVGRVSLVVEYYTMSVNVVRGPMRPGRLQTVTITQTIWNYSGYQWRRRDSGTWTAWTQFYYVSAEQLEEVRQIAEAGCVL